MVAIPTSDYDASRTAGECCIFQLFGQHDNMMQDVQGKLNPGLTWQKQHSTRGRLFSPANWT
jgi:hypothetical protein